MTESEFRLLIITESAEIEGPFLRVAEDLPASFEKSNYVQASNALEISPPDIIVIFDNDVNRIVRWLAQSDTELPIIVAASDPNTSLLPCLEYGSVDYFYCTGKEAELFAHVIRRNLTNSKAMAEEYRGLERDQQSGFRAQQILLPASPASLGGLRFNHQLFPRMIMSGDSVDYFELSDGRIAFVIADVSGHGAAGAFVTVVLKSLSRQLIAKEDGVGTTGDILEWINQELLQWKFEQHVTMFLGIIDPLAGYLEYSSAAHFPGTIVRHSDSAEFLNIGGQALGLYSKPSYPAHRVELPDDYAIVMFSDGVFEIMGEMSLVDKEARLLSVVKSCGENADELIGELAEALGIHSNASIPDDMAFFTIASAGY